MKRRPGAGRLLALEGIDGVGKSTLQRTLIARLRRRGLRVAAWREPVDPERGRRAQRLGRGDPLGAATEFTMDRLLARPRLAALLQRVDLVVSDRSFYSTLAYQGSALPPSVRAALARLQRSASIEPDRVLLLDLSIAAALGRVGRRGSPPAPLEHRRTLARAVRTYRATAAARRWWVVDAGGGPAEIADEAERRVLRWVRGRPAAVGRRG